MARRPACGERWVRDNEVRMVVPPTDRNVTYVRGRADYSGKDRFVCTEAEWLAWQGGAREILAVWHPAVAELAERHGVKLSNRNCYMKHVFDGRSVALFSQLGPLSDHDVIHEIAHYVAAAPEQRDLPEFGLGNFGSGLGNAYVDEVVDRNESYIQESMAQMLCTLWGKRYGITTYLSEENPDFVAGWDEYLKLKIESAHKDFDPAEFWIAMFRLQSLGFLPQEDGGSR